MRASALDTQIHVAAPIEEVFRFFADARNLEKLTPPFLKFNVLTEGEIDMQAGTRIDYELRVRGIPLKWQSEITVWEPPRRFVDEQRRGPYRSWVHEHRFEACEGGTLVRDHVDYAVWGGFIVDRLFVARDLRKIFAYREKMLRKTFGGDAPERIPTGG